MTKIEQLFPNLGLRIQLFWVTKLIVTPEMTL